MRKKLHSMFEFLKPTKSSIREDIKGSRVGDKPTFKIY